MTEKRFTYWEEDIGQMLIPQCRDNGKTVARSVYECVDLLNELAEENDKLRTQVMENNCDNCKYSKAIYADVECRKKGLTEWKYNCDEFNGDVE